MKLILSTAILCLSVLNSFSQDFVDPIGCDNWESVKITLDTVTGDQYSLIADLGITIKKKNRNISGLSDLTDKERVRLKKQACKARCKLVYYQKVVQDADEYFIICAGYGVFKEN